jgi:hypothetical protein
MQTYDNDDNDDDYNYNGRGMNNVPMIFLQGTCRHDIFMSYIFKAVVAALAEKSSAVAWWGRWSGEPMKRHDMDDGGGVVWHH